MIILYLPIGIMSLIIQLLSLLLAAIYGVYTLDPRKGFKCGCYMMLLANIFGQIVIAGGGPAACIGFIALPLFGGAVGAGAAAFAAAIKNKSNEGEIINGAS